MGKKIMNAIDGIIWGSNGKTAYFFNAYEQVQ